MGDDRFNGLSTLITSILLFRKLLLKRSFTRSLTSCMDKFEQPCQLAKALQVIALILLTGS